MRLSLLIIASLFVLIGCDRDQSGSAQSNRPSAQAVPTADTSMARPAADSYRATSAGSPSAFPTTRPGQFISPSDTPGANLPPSGGDAVNTTNANK
jgi:hypothetical protein